jgi:ankyrin repeat protein
MKKILLLLLLPFALISCKSPEERAWDSKTINDASKMKKVLDAGVSPNLEAGTAPRRFLLQAATEGHRVETVKLLLARGADPDKRTWGFGKTCLFLAAYGKNLQLAQALIDGGADVNATDENGNTALREANGMKSAKMVELLMKNGANPLITNKSGETMLDLAKKYGTPEIVELMENPVEQAVPPNGP